MQTWNSLLFTAFKEIFTGSEIYILSVQSDVLKMRTSVICAPCKIENISITTESFLKYLPSKSLPQFRPPLNRTLLIVSSWISLTCMLECQVNDDCS